MKVLVLIDDGSVDSAGESFGERVTLPSDPVMVTSEYSGHVADILGRATLLRGPDGNVWADIELRSDVSAGTVLPLYPCIGGRLAKREGKPGRWVLTGVTVESLTLCMKENVDKRIRTIGEQLVRQALDASFVGQAPMVPRKVTEWYDGAVEVWLEPVAGHPDQAQPVLRFKEPLHYIKMDFTVESKP